MAVDVSVVVVSWNTRQLLRECLCSLASSSGVGYEVVVVDNASADGSAAMVREEFPVATVIENGFNRGFAAATNQGLDSATGRHVLLLNSDAYLEPDTLAEVVAFLDAHPEAGVVGCRILNPDGSLQPSCLHQARLRDLVFAAAGLCRLLPGSRIFGRVDMTWWAHDAVREVQAVKGCFFLMRREILEQVGAFDERFFVYGEEVDWCLRAGRAGWKVLFTPRPTVVHVGGASALRAPLEMVLQLQGSVLLLQQKHRGRRTYQVARLIIAVHFLSRIVPWALLGLRTGQRGRAARIRARACCMGFLRVLTRGARGLCVSTLSAPVPIPNEEPDSLHI